MRIIGRLLFLLFFQAQAHADMKDFSFFQDFSENEILQWERRPSRDILLKRLKSRYPELKIIILDLKAPQFASFPIIRYQDPQVDENSYQYYLERVRRFPFITA